MNAASGVGNLEIWVVCLSAGHGVAFASELLLPRDGVRRLTLKLALKRLSKGLRPALIVIETYPDEHSEVALAELKNANPEVPVIFLSKWDTAQEMHAWFARRVLQALQPDQDHTRETYNTCGLSRRELEILKLLVQGLITKEIGEALSISYHTVDQHQRRIFRKLNVHTRSAAVAKALMEKIC